MKEVFEFIFPGMMLMWVFLHRSERHERFFHRTGPEDTAPDARNNSNRIATLDFQNAALHALVFNLGNFSDRIYDFGL